MVYKRYIKRNGRKLGPYYYKSVRAKDGKVRSVYIGKNKLKRKKRKFFLKKHEIQTAAFFLFLFMLLALLKPEMIGFVVYENDNYIETVNAEFNESSSYVWTPEMSGRLESLAITGSIRSKDAQNESAVIVYLDHENLSVIYNISFLPTNETDIMIFSNECMETCQLSIENLSYTFQIELRNSILVIENITYTVTLHEETNTTENETEAHILSDVILQQPAEISKPVEWHRTVNYSGSISNTTFYIQNNSLIIDVFKDGQENITSLVNVSYGENTSIFVPVDFISVKIIYSTPAPLKEEKTTGNITKQIILRSAYQYENVFVYTLLNETNIFILNFYVYENDTKMPYNATYNDTNYDSLVDRIEWIASNFTETTFEIETLNETQWKNIIPPPEGPRSSGCSGDTPPETGDWLVTTPTTCENMTIDLLGHLNITSNLTLRNVTLTLNATDNGQFNITANQSSGAAIIEFHMINSTIQSNSSAARFGFRVLNNTNFNMTNSTVRYVGWSSSPGHAGLELNTSGNVKIENSFILSGYNGISIYSTSYGNISIINTTIFNSSLYGIYCLQRNNVTIINSTINASGTTGIHTSYCVNITIDGSTVANTIAEHGIVTDSAASIIIMNSTITANNNSGIVVSASNSVYLRNNTVSFNGMRGIHFTNAVTDSTADLNRVLNNTFDGILLNTPSTTRITLSNNTVTANNISGIRIISSADNNTALDNVLVGNVQYGLRVANSHNNLFMRNIVNASPVGLRIENDAENNIVIDTVIDMASAAGAHMNTTMSSKVQNTILINTTYVNITDSCTATSLCNLTVKWYIDIIVNDSGGGINSANISYYSGNYDGENGVYDSVLTGANGRARQNLTEFIWFNPGINSSWNPYTLTTTADGYIIDSRQINVTNSAEIYITLRKCSGNDPPASGDWVVNQTTICENMTIDLFGHLNITAVDVGGAGESLGNLTLRNTTLNLNSTAAGKYNITADQPTGTAKISLLIYNSTIRSNSSSAPYLLNVWRNTDFDMVNSTIMYAGYSAVNKQRGLEINTTGSVYAFTKNRIVDSFYGITITGANVNLTNNTIVNSTGHGIACGNATNIVIQNNTVRDSGIDGIRIWGCSNVTVDNNLVNTTVHNGIHLTSSARNVTIKNNTVVSALTGIYANSAYGLLVLNNTVSSSRHVGIGLMEIENATIDQNIASNNTNEGIKINSTFNGFISRTIITNNIANGNLIGIRLNITWGNTLYNNRLSSNTYGMYIYSADNNNISRNIINNSVYGLFIQDGSANNRYVDNSIINSSAAGLVINMTAPETSDNTLINTTYVNVSYQDIEQFLLTVQWYLDVNVNNTNDALNGANVTSFDKNLVNRASTLTNANGKSRQNLTEFTSASRTDTTYYTPYTINTTYAEHKTNTTTLNITQSMELFITIKDIPVITLDTPKNNSLDADGGIQFFINITDVSGIRNITFYDNFTGAWDANVTFYPFNKNYLSPNAGFDVPNYTTFAGGDDDEADWVILAAGWTCNTVNESIGGSTKLAANCTRTANTTTAQQLLTRYLTDDRISAGNNNFTMEPNTAYYFSGWMKTLMRSGGANFSFLSGGGTNCTTTPLTYSTDWTFMTCNVTTDSTVTSAQLQLRSVNANGILGSILIDNLSITKINQSLPEHYEDRPVYLSIEEDDDCTILDECSFLDGQLFYNYGINCGPVIGCFDYAIGAQTNLDDDMLTCSNDELCNASFTITNLSYDGIFNLWSYMRDAIGDSVWWSTDNVTYTRRQNASSANWYLVLENTTVNSGNLTVYIKKNVSNGAGNFDRLRLVPVNPKPGNITAMRANFNFTGIANGKYIWNALAFDVLGKNGFADANYTIVVGTASVAIAASGNFSTIRWNITSLSSNQIDLPAESNNGTGPTDYYVNISTAGTTADVYIKVNGNLTSGGSVITLNNEKFAYNTTNSTVPSKSNQSISTDYIGVGTDLGDGTIVYFKFFLNVTTGTSAGVYNNSVTVKVVSNGDTP